MQALEPHSYGPPTAAAAIETLATSTPVTALSLPSLPGLPEKKQIPVSLDEISADPVKVLNAEEQLTYLATSAIRELNAEKLFFAPKDSRAYPYGKNDTFVIERPSNLVRTS